MPRGHVLPDRDTVAMLRGEAGLTQQNLADRTGYGVRTISKIESGQPTSSSALAAIAIVLAESLGRPIQLVDLVCQRPGASPGLHAPGGAMLVAENIKLLELRSLASSSASTATGSRPRSVLIDTFRLRYLPANLGEIDFHYAAMGKAHQRSLAFASRTSALVTRRSATPSAAVAYRAAAWARVASHLAGHGKGAAIDPAKPRGIRRCFR